MKTIELENPPKKLLGLIDDAQEDAVLLLHAGRRVAMIVGLDDRFDAESIALSKNPKFRQIVRRSLAQARAGKTISLEEMRRRLKLPRKKKANGIRRNAA